MKTKRIIALTLLVIMAGASCQIQTPTIEAPAADTLAPIPETPPPPVGQPVRITADNLADLQKIASLQVSSGALTCGWSSDSQLITIMDITWAGLYRADGLELAGEFTGDEYTALYAASADASLAAYSLDGVMVQFYDFAAKADRFSVTPDYQYGTVFFSSDGAQVGITSLEAIAVALYGTEAGENTGSLTGFETAAPVYSAAFSPDGSYLLWLSRGTAQPMEISSGSFKPAFSHEDFIAASRMSHDNRLTATAAAGTLDGVFQPLVTLWDTETGAQRWQAGNTDYFSALAFSADDTFIAAGTLSGVIFYDSVSGEELARFLTGGDLIGSLAFSPDGQSLLTCSTDGIATVWSIP